MVEDYPSPNTAEAAWIPVGVMDGDPAALMRKHYAEFGQGQADFRHEGNLLTVRVSSDRGPILEARFRIMDEEPSFVSSVDRYIGRDEHGRLVSSLVSVTSEGALPVEFKSLEIAPEADPVWQAFAPVSLDWAGTVPLILAHWSEPSPIYPDQDMPHAAREALLALLNQHGRACAILRADATVLHHNLLARELLPLGPNPDMFRDKGDWQRFLDAVSQVAAGQTGVLPFQFAAGRRDHRTPVILHLTPVDPALCGPNRALLLLTDPEAGIDRPITGLLQLLGLTPAEARVAAAVGRGLPPRNAAEMLGVAESTIRSTLKVIFDKLNLSRQAELVALIARLVMG